MIQETEEKALVSQALEARKLAYAPYSRLYGGSGTTDWGWTQIPWR